MQRLPQEGHSPRGLGHLGHLCPLLSPALLPPFRDFCHTQPPAPFLSPAPLQDYGPKVNFRKQKLKPAGFCGLPDYSREVVRRMGLYPGLESFRPVEQCNLDYCPERGSAIDPHLDDAWLWGERLVSLNLLSATVLSLCREAPGSLLLGPAPAAGPEAPTDSLIAPSRSVPCQEVEVAVALPRRSLLVLTGAARHQWQHAIHRRHIEARRVCATFRELAAEFRPGGRQQELGQELLGLALSFQGRPV